MEYNAFLVKYAEIGIKGKNRRLFEDALIKQIKFSLESVGDFSVFKEQGRIFVKANDTFDQEETISALQRVFGISAICPVVIKESAQWEDLAKAVCEYVDHAYPDKNITFKVLARRADKSYPKKSFEIAADLGAEILDRFP